MIKPTPSSQDSPLIALGLMSGTSLDGIDAALIRTDGLRVFEFGPAATFPYPTTFRDSLRNWLGRRPEHPQPSLEREIAHRHAEAVTALLAMPEARRWTVDLIGFHGQTVWHCPAAGETVQWGDGQLLADLTGLPVINDFRTNDVAAGGEGAPLVPLYHAALATRLPRPLIVLNVGGVANLTWIGARTTDEDRESADVVIACDTGPGNALIDDWILRQTGCALDADGATAAAGTAKADLVDRWLEHPYFARPIPKSLDRDAFSLALGDIARLSVADGAATLVDFTASAVERAVSLLPQRPRQCLVCGGGRHNRALMRGLEMRLGMFVAPVESVGWRGDVLEAEAFAFLAVRSRKGLPLTLPTTTGVKRPLSGGRYYRPSERTRSSA